MSFSHCSCCQQHFLQTIEPLLDISLLVPIMLGQMNLDLKQVFTFWCIRHQDHSYTRFLAILLATGHFEAIQQLEPNLNWKSYLHRLGQTEEHSNGQGEIDALLESYQSRIDVATQFVNDSIKP